MDTVEIERSCRIIKKALRKYPLELLKTNLSKIYILKSLEFYEIVKEHEKLNQKLDLIIEFYSKLSESLTKEFFMKLNNGNGHNK